MKKLIRITTVPVSLAKLLEDQLSYMSAFYKVIAVSSNEKALKQVGEKEQVDTFCINLTRQITPIQDISAVIKLYRFLKNEQPFIVHTHTPKAGIIGMLAAKLAGVPHRLHTVAGLPLLEAFGGKRKLLNNVEKLTYKCATKVYPNSQGLQDIIVENKLALPGKLKIIANGSSNGIDTTHFNPELIPSQQKENLRRQSAITPDDFVFVFVGRIVGDKGINELVSAFSELSTTNKNIKLVLVGPLESNLDPLKPNTLLNISSNKQIVSVGYQDDVRPYLAISNTLVFPSYREGFPNVVMQAGAMGLPSIVSDINGCNEIIQDGENGKIIPVKNTKAIEEAMQFMLDNPQVYERMKKNTREVIVEKYQREVVCKALLDEYKTLD